MSMDPQQFHDLLTDAVRNPPVDHDLARDLAAGQRRLRRRRSAIGASVLAVVGVVGLSAAGIASQPTHHDGTHGGHGDGGISAVSPPTSDTDLLRSCRDGNQSDRTTTSIFGSGQPTVEAEVRTSYQVVLAIEAADGRHWAECFVHLTTQEFSSGMTLRTMTGDVVGSTDSSGPACGQVDGHADPTCRTFQVSTAERLPSEVAAVEFRTGDGRTTRVPTHDRYLVLNYLGRLPAGISTTRLGGWEPDFRALQRITYLDAAGERLPDPGSFPVLPSEVIGEGS